MPAGLHYTLASTDEELLEVLELQSKNLPGNISPEVKNTQGFVTVKHTLDLLRLMNQSAKQVIAKDHEKVVAYALVMKPELKSIVPVLVPMFELFESLTFNDKPLTSYSHYVMGQICVAEGYRGRGLFEGLYHKHREVYSPKYQLCITEVSISNQRSMRAHERVGFRTIHTFQDATDEWNIVAWDWS